jgi:hypothetical protein
LLSFAVHDHARAAGESTPRPGVLADEGAMSWQQELWNALERLDVMLKGMPQRIRVRAQ